MSHPHFKLFDSQLAELCAALGWQGGTYHQVLREVQRLKRIAALTDRCMEPDKVIPPLECESDSEGGEL